MDWEMFSFLQRKNFYVNKLKPSTAARSQGGLNQNFLGC